MNNKIYITLMMLMSLLMLGCTQEDPAQVSATSEPPLPQPAQADPSEAAVEAGPGLVIEQDIEYANISGQSLKLDIYRMAPAAAPSPVVVWIHGTDDPAASKLGTPAVGMIRRGDANTFAVVSIEYRTRGTEAEQLADAKAAVRWLRQNAGTYNVDPNRIAVIGFGTGARLAALLGTTAGVAQLDGNSNVSTRVQAVVALAGPMTSATINPVSYVTEDDAPTLLIHGTADAKVSTLESQALVAAFKVAGVATRMDMPMAVDHDLGALLTPEVFQNVRIFVDQQLTDSGSSTLLPRFVAVPSTAYVDPVALDYGGTQYKLYQTPSRGPNTYSSYRVYLPPGYEENANRRYPVIYFVHGARVDSRRAVDAGYAARADAAIRSGVMPPAIIIFPNALNSGRYVDAPSINQPMESIIVKDLISHVDSNYRTISTRAARAIEGHSMGGYGALHIGFKYPELFAAVTGNSAAVNDNFSTTEPVAGSSTVAASAEYWEAQHPSTLAKQNVSALQQQRIRIIVGTEDDLIVGCEKLSETLTSLGIEHEFIPVQGSPHNIDQLLQYETFDRMAVYREVFGSYF